MPLHVYQTIQDYDVLLSEVALAIPNNYYLFRYYYSYRYRRLFIFVIQYNNEDLIISTIQS